MARPGHKFSILDGAPQMRFTDTESDRLRPHLGLGARMAVSRLFEASHGRNGLQEVILPKMSFRKKAENQIMKEM